jgi:glycosyltransferase involved in cell wall biosynthesis
MASKNTKLRIGIDCRTMLNPLSGERAGVGHYTFHIVKAILAVDRRNEYVLYFDHRMPAAVTEAFVGPRVMVRRLPFSRYGKWLPFAYAHLLLAAYLQRDNLDVFHAPANVMPLSYNRPTVVTIHDLAIYQHPEWFPSQVASTKILVPQTVRNAAAVIAVSQATKKDLIKTLRVPAKKIQVVYEAADTGVLQLRDRNVNVHRTYKLPSQYFLYVGTIDPRKSITSLIQAWQRLVATQPRLTANAALVIAGGAGYRGDDVVRLIKKLNLPSLRYLGYVSHNHKIQLMKSATAFVFPTRYEGFGLPVLEAMQLGTPVITTNISSIPEVTGTAAWLYPPDDVAALTKLMRQALSRPAVVKKLRRAGQAQAKKFSWTKAARETLAVYERVAHQR